MEKLNINSGCRGPPAGKDDAERGGSLERCRTASHPHRLRQYGRNRRDTDAAHTRRLRQRPQPPGQMGGAGLLPIQRHGPAKSITVMASLELGKRRKLQERSGRTAIRSSADIYELFHPLLCDLATEEFWVLLMNHAAKVIDKVRISRGGIDQTTADVRSILREALLQRATQIALIHNHPSGNPHPSNDDQRLTELVRKAAQTMNIHLTDHVIVTDGSHYSFNDEGLL